MALVGAVPAAMLRPSDPSARIVGRALTVRNIPASAPVPEMVKAGVSGLGEIEAHNLAEPGDVLVVQGVDRVSNLGGMSATIGHRQGEIGAIVDGGARDVDHSRAIGLPVWSRSVSPITGKWRVETVAINKPVTIAGVTVDPGDLVLADETGVCFVPRQRAAEVLARAQRNVAAEKVARSKDRLRRPGRRTRRQGEITPLFAGNAEFLDGVRPGGEFFGEPRGESVMTEHAVNAVGGEALLDLGLFDHGEQRLL